MRCLRFYKINFSTDVNGKKTFSGTYLNWNSFNNWQYKMNLFYCFTVASNCFILSLTKT